MIQLSSNYKRILGIALSLLLGFVAVDPIQASEPGIAPAISALKLPSELGHISQRLPAAASSEKKSKLVLIIQDAHGNYTAQMSMAGILDYLAERYGLKLIFMEGAEGDASLAHLRHTGPLSVRKQTAENYLKAGLISGEEYIDMISDRDWVVWGAEDITLYEKNYNAMLESEALRPQIEQQLNAIQQTVDQLKNKLYSSQLKELESRIQSYASGGFKLSGYLKYLADQSLQANVTLEPYPNIRKIAGLASAIGDIQAIALLKEIPSLERSLINQTAQMPEEKQLLDLQKGLTLFTKAVAREWTPDGYRAYREHQDSWLFSRWIPELKDLASANGVAFAWQNDVESLDSSLKQAIGFFDATLERDQAMLMNIQDKMASEGQVFAAFVVGGFHTQNLANLLVQSGVNVVVLTPVVGKDDTSVDYLEIMKYKYQDYQHKHSPRRSDEPLATDSLE